MQSLAGPDWDQLRSSPELRKQVLSKELPGGPADPFLNFRALRQRPAPPATPQLHARCTAPRAPPRAPSPELTATATANDEAPASQKPQRPTSAAQQRARPLRHERPSTAQARLRQAPAEAEAASTEPAPAPEEQHRRPPQLARGHPPPFFVIATPSSIPDRLAGGGASPMIARASHGARRQPVPHVQRLGRAVPSADTALGSAHPDVQARLLAATPFSSYVEHRHFQYPMVWPPLRELTPRKEATRCVRRHHPTIPMPPAPSHRPPPVPSTSAAGASPVMQPATAAMHAAEAATAAVASAQRTAASALGTQHAGAGASVHAGATTSHGIVEGKPAGAVLASSYGQYVHGNGLDGANSPRSFTATDTRPRRPAPTSARRPMVGAASPRSATSRAPLRMAHDSAALRATRGTMRG